MIGIFKQKTPVNILILFVAGILLKLSTFTHPHAPLVTGEDSFLYSQLAGWMQSRLSPAIIAALTYGLIFLQAMIVNRFVSDYRMIQKSTFLPGMSYLLISSLLPEWNWFSAPLLINTFLLLIFFALFRLYNLQQIRGMVFNIGLILGLSSFFLTSSLLFIVWVLPALFVMRPIRIQDWIICIMGLLTPYYFYAAYLVITGEWALHKILPQITFHIPVLEPTFWLPGAALLILIPFLVGGYFIQVNLRRMLIQVRKNWSLVLIYLLVSLLIPFLSGGEYFENWVVIIIPFSIFHSCAYFYPKARFFPLLLFWGTVAFVVAREYLV